MIKIKSIFFIVFQLILMFEIRSQCVFSVSQNNCVDEAVFINSSLSMDDEVKWDINGDILFNIANPTYVFKTSGLKYIKMYVKIHGDDVCFYQKFVQVNAKPTINFSVKKNVDDSCNRRKFCFVDSSVSNDINGKIKKRIFVFDDGAKKEFFGDGKITFCHEFSGGIGAEYVVTVDVIDSNGCSVKERFSGVIKIEKIIGASFNSNQPRSCNMVEMCVLNKSLIELSNVKSFVWHWGDNTTSVGNKDSVNLWGTSPLCRLIKTQGPNQGGFNTKLIVNDVFGCSDSFEYKNSAINLIVKSNKILASVDSVCFSNAIISFKLKDTIYQANNPVFNFGDPASGSFNIVRNWNASHRFSKTGVFKVNFSYTHPYVGCINIFFDTILVIGPQTIIDDAMADRILPNLRTQCVIKDTVRFVNNSLFYHNDNVYSDDDSVVLIDKDSVLVNRTSGVILDASTVGYNPAIHEWVKPGFNAPMNHSFNNRPNGQVSLTAFNQKRGNSHVDRLWDFDDSYCEQCTTDSKNGLNIKKNCRFSKDSMPKHWYTPWETIYKRHYSKLSFLIKEFNKDSGNLYTRNLWVDDSMAIIKDTLLFYGDNSLGNSIRDSLSFKDISNKIKIASGGFGKYETFFEAKGLIYIPNNHSVLINKNDGNGWVVIVGPKYQEIDKKYLIKSNLDSSRFFNVYQLQFLEDTIPLCLLETNDKLWKKVKNNNFNSKDSVSADLHRQMFYNSNVVSCYEAKLSQKDMVHHLSCQDEKTVVLSLQPPSAKHLRKEGVLCLGGSDDKYGITFVLEEKKPSCSFSWAEINFDTTGNKNAWKKLIGPNLTVGSVSQGNLPPLNSQYLGYNISGFPKNRFSKQYELNQIKDTLTGFINVGLIVGNGYWSENLNSGINVNTYGYPLDCIDTVYYNKFARFPVMDNKFRIIKSKEGEDFTKICRKDTICVTTNIWNRTYLPDVSEAVWSIANSNAGIGLNQNYFLKVNEKYVRFKEVIGNPNVLEDYLIITKSHSLNGVLTELKKDSIKIATVTKWHSEADISPVFDLVKSNLEKSGLNIYDLNPSQINDLIWNGIGVLNKPYTGSRGIIDTSGFGHLIKFIKVADQKIVLHHRDSTLLPIDKTIGWDGKQYNAYCFVPEYSGFYTASFSLKSNDPASCSGLSMSNKKVLVGFHAEFNFSDTILQPGQSIISIPQFRYYEPYPNEKSRVLDPKDYWRNRVSEAGNPNREMLTKWDLSKDDDDVNNPFTIFGGFPYGASGLGIPTSGVRFGNIPGGIYYNQDSGRVYILRTAVGDSSGCKDTFSQKIYTAFADVDFKVDKVVSFCNREVELTNLTDIEDPCLLEFGKPCLKIIKSTIDWGDGFKSVFVNEMPTVAKHQYANNYLYKIVLSIETEILNSNSFFNELKIHTKEKYIEMKGVIPFFDTLIPRYYFVNDEVVIENLSKYNRSDSAIWIWEMGDGNTIVQRDTLTSDVSKITYRYKSQGRYYITLNMYKPLKTLTAVCTYQFPNEHTKSKFFVDIVDSNTTVIKNPSYKQNWQLRIVPNPNTGYCKLKIQNIELDNLTITIKDMTGKTVYSKFAEKLKDEMALNVDFLSKGLYFITIENQINSVTQKIIIH